MKNKGASLLLTLLIMAGLLAIAFGISKLTMGEIKLVRDISKSIIAYYAAETGIEQALYDERVEGGASNTSGQCSVALGNGSSYGLRVDRAGENVTIKSTGCFKDIIRAIEINY